MKPAPLVRKAAAAALNQEQVPGGSPGDCTAEDSVAAGTTIGNAAASLGSQDLFLQVLRPSQN
jgi:hypothetical protein